MEKPPTPTPDIRVVTAVGALLLAQRFNQPLWLEPIKEINTSLEEQI